ncbi:MAG: hypothetical protein OXC83_02280 [Chloroflexi bacterium]|nr:hypothetical protein [Chloroflexota bacterium]
MVATSEAVQLMDPESDELPEVSSDSGSEIPVRNWWHMLLYAWGLVDLEGMFQSKWEDAPDLHELLTRILVDRMNRQVRRWLRGDYVDRSEALRTVRGRIDFNRTLGDLLLYKGRLHCEYQEYSVNVPRNQIIATTLQRQYRRDFAGAKDSDIEELKSDVVRLVRTLDEIDQIRLDRSVMANEIRQLGRNEREYKLLLKVCEMLYRPRMPLDSDESDADAFRDWNEKQRHDIFETFVANFFKLNLDLSVWSVNHHRRLSWQIDEAVTVGELIVPGMETDISVTHRENKQVLIFDTKFYKEPFKGRSGKPTVNSGHLYQLYAYLSKSDDKERPMRPTGILLYGEPSSGPGQLRTRIDGFPVFVKTLNLNQDWKNVETDLLCVFHEVVAGV